MNALPAIPEEEDYAGPEIIVFQEDASKGEIVQTISERIPQNEYGLPTFFIRSDLLSGYQLAEDEIDAAAVGLYYHEGYPTLPTGATFWNQLPHEPHTMFEWFQAYLDQAAEVGIRQLDALAVKLNTSLKELSDVAKEYYWSARARAYDMFIVAAEAKRRQHRIRSMENQHFVKAEKLFEEVMGRFVDDEDGDSWVEELTAKEAIEVLESLIKVQRMSVGLVGQHSSSTAQQFGEGEATESMIRKIAQDAGASSSTSDKFVSQLKNLLDNPEEGATIQAAVIKMTAPNNRTTFQEDM